MSTGVEIVTKMFEEWNAHDLDAVYGRLTDDYREYANGVLVKVGRVEARAADEALYEMLPDYRRTVNELWGVDDRVAARFSIHGTMSDGKPFEVAVVASTVYAKVTSARLICTSIQQAHSPRTDLAQRTADPSPS